MQAPLTGLSKGRRLARGAELLDAPNELDRVAKRFRKPRQGRLHSLACGCRRETRPTPVRQPLAPPPGRPTSAICGCRTKRHLHAEQTHRSAPAYAVRRGPDISPPTSIIEDCSWSLIVCRSPCCRVRCRSLDCPTACRCAATSDQAGCHWVHRARSAAAACCAHLSRENVSDRRRTQYIFAPAVERCCILASCNASPILLRKRDPCPREES